MQQRSPLSADQIDDLIEIVAELGKTPTSPSQKCIFNVATILTHIRKAQRTIQEFDPKIAWYIPHVIKVLSACPHSATLDDGMQNMVVSLTIYLRGAIVRAFMESTDYSNLTFEEKVTHSMPNQLYVLRQNFSEKFSLRPKKQSH